MAANLNVFKSSKKDGISSKSNYSFVKVHWVIYRIRKENKKFDHMGTLSGYGYFLAPHRRKGEGSRINAVKAGLQYTGQFT